MIYNPNTYDASLFKEKNLTLDNILPLQVKYRESIEKEFMKYFDFKSIDKDFIDIGCFPLEDTDYNFYHKYSTLGSNFVYLRNNYHIERLDIEEINYIKKCITNNEDLSLEFLSNTAERILIEQYNGDIFYNNITSENSVTAKSLVFEFSYDVFKFTEVGQFKKADRIVKDKIKEIQEAFKDKLYYPVNGITYKGNPDIFKEENIASKKI